MLSGQDRDRLKVLHQVIKKEITQAAAATNIRLTNPSFERPNAECAVLRYA